MNILFVLAAACFVGLGSVSSAGAATINFDGASSGAPLTLGEYKIDDARIVSGQCSVKPCLALNKLETSILTRVDGGTFTLSSIWFYLDGKASKNSGLNDLVITSTGPAASIRLGQDAAFGGYDNNKPFTYNFGSLFEDVTSIIFSSYNGEGNVRIDDIVVTPSEVPLPASLMFGVMGLACLGALRRRRLAPVQAA